MLAQIEPTRNDFHALATYLIHGKERPTHPDRCAWVLAQNLPTDDPMLAADYMAATAELSRRCANACAHISINWRADEAPSPEIMQDIARRTLTMAGLAEHQALVMGHGDKPHRHLHMMINRVHPVTGRAWSESYSKRRFDRIMKQLAEDYGFIHVPCHAFDPDATDDLPTAPPSNARYAAKRGAKTTRRQWSARQSRDVGALMSERLDRLSTWEDVQAMLAEFGITLEPKGRGHVVGNATSYSKLSRLGLMVTANGLAKRKAATPRSRRAPPKAKVQARTRRTSLFAVDAVTIARALGTRDDVRHAVQQAMAQRKARIAKKPLMEQLMAEMAERWRASTSLENTHRKRPHRRPRARSKSSRLGHRER